MASKLKIFPIFLIFSPFPVQSANGPSKKKATSLPMSAATLVSFCLEMFSFNSLFSPSNAAAASLLAEPSPDPAGMFLVRVILTGGFSAQSWNSKSYAFEMVLDESEGAMKAVHFVGAMLKGSTKEVTLFHAVRGFNIFERRYGHTVSLKDEQEWLDAYKMDSVLKEAKAHLLKSGFGSDQVNAKILKGVDSRANAIFLEAVAGGYSTVVLGRRGISRVKDFCMGRVCSKVIQLARNQAVWIVS